MRHTNQKAFSILSLFVGIFLLFSLSGTVGSGAADQPDFPLIYIDEGCDGTHVGSIANPYDDFADINWSAGGDNSITDYYAGEETASVTINLMENDEWREQLTVGASGSATYPIIIRSYGSGADPIVNGANVYNTADWTADSTTVTPSVAANDDDIHVRPSLGSWASSDNNKCYFGHATNNIDFNAGIRFQLNVALEANITAATITIQEATGDTGTVRTKVHAHDVDDSDQITDYAEWETDHGTLTTADADWDITTPTQDQDYTSPSLVSIVQEIVDRGGWVANQYIQFFIDDDTSDMASWISFKNFESGSDYPSLSVTYGTANVWYMDHPSGDLGNNTVVVVDGTRYSPVATKGELTTNKFFVDTVPSPDVLYVYLTDDPDNHVTEVTARLYGVLLDQRQYVTIENIEARYCGYAGIRPLNAQANGYCVFDGCTLYHNRISGIQIYLGHENNTVKNCTSTYNGNGFYSNQADNNTFSNNTAEHNIHYTVGGTTDGHGIGIYDSDDCVVEGNTLNDNYSNINVDAHSADNSVIIRYNYSHDCKSGSNTLAVGDFAVGSTCEIYYNILNPENGSALETGPCAGTGTIYNNVVYDSRAGNSGAMVYHGSADNWTFKNNLLYAAGTGSWLMNVASGSIVSDYNSFYYPNGTNIIRNGIVDYTSVALWNAASGEDANSLETDPLMIDVANNDFRLLMASPCVDAGVDVGLTEDYEGTPVPQSFAPDIGAYEFASGIIPLLIPVIIPSIIPTIKIGL